MDLCVTSKFGVVLETALGISQRKSFHKVTSLLERFTINPSQTRHEVRLELGIVDEPAAELFVLIVFLCDHLLQLKPVLAHSKATRFFAVASSLPMELQMVLCRRAVGSMKQSILTKDSEVAFKALARILLLSQPN